MSRPYFLKTGEQMVLPALIATSGRDESRQHHLFSCFQKVGPAHLDGLSEASACQLASRLLPYFQIEDTRE